MEYVAVGPVDEEEIDNSVSKTLISKNVDASDGVMIFGFAELGLIGLGVYEVFPF